MIPACVPPDAPDAPDGPYAYTYSSTPSIPSIATPTYPHPSQSHCAAVPCRIIASFFFSHPIYYLGAVVVILVQYGMLQYSNSYH